MKKTLELKIIYILIIIYSLYDILNSASAGNTTGNRGMVYIFLIMIVLSMTIFILIRRYILVNNIILSLILFSIFDFIDTCVIKGNISWSAFVNLGLSIWWIVTVLFFSNVIYSKIETFESIQKFMRLIYILFAMAILYGAFNITLNFAVDYARVGYIYHILAMLPLILLEKNSKLKLFFLILAISLTIFSFKRGAIIIMPSMLLVYFITENKIGLKKNNLIHLIVLILMVCIAWGIIDKYSNGYLSSRFLLSELSDGSGRADIWKAALNNISKRNVIQLLFGISSSNEIELWTGIHNEWISYLNSNGIIGLILFTNIIFSIICQAIKLVRKKSCIAPTYMALVVYVIGVCWVSGFYHVHSTFYIMLYIGSIQGLLMYQEEKIYEIVGKTR